MHTKETFVIWIEYNGKNYAGWQIQPDQITIQDKIQQALKILFRQRLLLHAVSRTDKGVHAKSQVAAFSITSPNLPVFKIKHSLNALLPGDISVWQIKKLSPDYAIKNSVVSKKYIYRLSYASDSWPTFNSDIFWHVPFNLDVNKMLKAKAKLVGTHDFRAFRGQKCQSRTTIKSIYSIEFQKLDSTRRPSLALIFCGNGFLRHMIRIIVGSLVAIGKGNLEASAIAQALESGRRSDLGQTAPAKGLCLEAITFCSQFQEACGD